MVEPFDEKSYIMLSRTLDTRERKHINDKRGEGGSMMTMEFKIKSHGKDQSEGNSKIENQYQSQ
jgi:hypothetical protein